MAMLMKDRSKLPGCAVRILHWFHQQSSSGTLNYLATITLRGCIRRLAGEAKALFKVLRLVHQLLHDPKVKARTNLWRFLVAFLRALPYEAVSNDGTSSEEVAAKCLGHGNFAALHGKVALITGASNGLGLENARVLMKYGCHVIWAVRNPEKARAAIAQFEENEGKFSGKATILKVDLSDLTTIKPFVTAFLDLNLPLHYLVLNAGIMSPAQWEPSAQGFELQFATNNLSHFLMTELLLDKVKETAEHGEARIIILSSIAGTLCSNMDVSNLPTPEGYYHEIADYAVSKACDAIHARHLQSRLRNTNVWVTAVHPGIIETGLGQGNHSVTNLLYGAMISGWARQGVTSGAATTLHCALSSEIPEQVKGGKFYYFNRASQTPMGAMANCEDLCEPLHARQLEIVRPFM